MEVEIVESKLNNYIVNFYFDEENYLKVLIKAESDGEIFRILTRRNDEGSKWINFPNLSGRVKESSKTINLDKVLYYEIEPYQRNIYNDHRDEEFLLI
jgi:hypothetical protein